MCFARDYTGNPHVHPAFRDALNIFAPKAPAPSEPDTLAEAVKRAEAKLEASALDKLATDVANADLGAVLPNGDPGDVELFDEMTGPMPVPAPKRKGGKLDRLCRKCEHPLIYCPQDEDGDPMSGRTLVKPAHWWCEACDSVFDIGEV